MTCHSDYDWELVAGDDSVRVFTYQDSAGAAIDLTGYTALLTYDVGELTGTGSAVVNGPAGTITGKLDDTVTALFTGNGTFRVKITSPSNDKLTLVLGKLLVTT